MPPGLKPAGSAALAWFAASVSVLVSGVGSQLPHEDGKVLKPLEEWDIRNELGLYRNLEEVLDVFKRDGSPISKQIVEAYQTECLYTEEPTLPACRRRAFIVVEGNHRPSKESVSAKLAGLLDARFMSQLAPCLQRFSEPLRGGHPLRRALQFLSLYALAFDARVHMALDRTVVLNGYWTEQLAFTVTRSFHAGELPPITADFFRQPADLMRPDLIVFLDFGEAIYTTTPAVTRFYQINNFRRTTSLKRRKLQVYRHLQARLPILVHHLQRVTNWATASGLVRLIRANLSAQCDFAQPTTPSYLDADYLDLAQPPPPTATT